MSCKFKLQNGLSATLYPTLEELPELYRLCANTQPSVTHYKSGQHCVVKIKLNKENIWLIFYCDLSRTDVKRQLQKNLANALNCVYLTIYCNRVYEATKPDIDLILESIKNKTSPNITVVLKPPMQ